MTARMAAVLALFAAVGSSAITVTVLVALGSAVAW